MNSSSPFESWVDPDLYRDDQPSCRVDKIRTCDPTPPRRVRYRAALHPEILNIPQICIPPLA